MNKYNFERISARPVVELTDAQLIGAVGYLTRVIEQGRRVLQDNPGDAVARHAVHPDYTAGVRRGYIAEAEARCDLYRARIEYLQALFGKERDALQDYTARSLAGDITAELYAQRVANVGVNLKSTARGLQETSDALQALSDYLLTVDA